MLMNIPEHVARRLESLAEQEGSTVGDLLETLLNRYSPDPPMGSLAEIAENAREAGLASAQRVDTAERSREILHQEYANYLKRRTSQDSDDDHSG